MTETSYRFVSEFYDNVDDWTKALERINSNIGFRKFIQITSRSRLLVVPNRPDLTLRNDRHQCHENCRVASQDGLGMPVSGWYLLTEYVFDDLPKGCLRMIHHCNLLLDDGSIFNITEDEGRKYHLFLPDDQRKFDFENNIGYNDRMVFGDDFMVGRDNIRAVPRNKVLYAISDEYDRDVQYEKFRIYNSKEDMLADIPKGLSARDTQRWILFKTNVNFGD